MSASIRRDMNDTYQSVWGLVACLVWGLRYCGESISADGGRDEDLRRIGVVGIGMDGWRGNVDGAWQDVGMVSTGNSAKLIVTRKVHLEVTEQSTPPFVFKSYVHI